MAIKLSKGKSSSWRRDIGTLNLKYQVRTPSNWEKVVLMPQVHNLHVKSQEEDVEISKTRFRYKVEMGKNNYVNSSIVFLYK